MARRQFQARERRVTRVNSNDISKRLLAAFSKRFEASDRVEYLERELRLQLEQSAVDAREVEYFERELRLQLEQLAEVEREVDELSRVAGEVAT